MTITELYDKLSDKDFQDYLTGNLFFPAYMYVYDPEKEYEIDQEIISIQNRLHRPNNYLDVMVLDIFDEFLNFLNATAFGHKSLLQDYLDDEPQMPAEVEDGLKQDATGDPFMNYLNARIKDHLNNAGNAEVAYVFVKGFGKIFPYLRASKFMNRFEKNISGYKMILFYPGEVKENYNLFKILNDEHLYRAIKLINQDV
ncbi:MAG: BREX protein BrxB domain-containing protein [Bacteroidales bacterium]